jgi:uncharacterized protein (TIGR02246 family)
MTIRPVLCVVLLCAGSATAKAECIAVDNAAIGALFDGWNLSLASLDPDVVAQRYWPDAVLLPTVSNTPRTSTAMIRDYFVHFLEKRPRGRIDSRTIQIGCNLAIDMGTYTFSVMAPTGAISEVAARYTFVYSHHDGAWKISHHHSSAMPETGASVPAPHTADAAPLARKSGGGHDVPRAAKVEVNGKTAAAGKDSDADAPAPDVTRLFMNAAKSPDIAQFYPGESRKKRESGDVDLQICAGPDGVLVGDPKILRSSGHERLDEAASAWVRAAKWVPATSNRRAVEGCAEVTARFRS